MATEVGSAYVRLRIISNNIRKDIKDAIEDPKNKKQLDSSMKKLTKGLSAGNSLIWKSILGVNTIGPAVTIIGAYISQFIAILGTIGPAAVAAGAAGLALAVTVKQVGSVLNTAFKTKTDMLDRYKEASKSLKEGLVNDVQANILPAAIAAQTRLLPLYRAQFVETSKVIASTLTSSSKLLSGPLGPRMQGIFKGNTEIVRTFASAVNPLLRILTQLVAVAQPMAQRWAKAFAGWIQYKATLTDSADGAARLSKIFQTGEKFLGQWATILVNIGSGLKGIFKAGLPEGGRLLTLLTQLTGKFASWANSTKGQNQLAKWFADSGKIVHEFNGLIGDLGRSIKTNLNFGSTDGIIQGIQTLRTGLVPVIGQIIATLTSAGPGLAELGKTILTLVQTLADSGALGAFSTTLIIIIKALTELLKLPVIGTIAKYAVVFLGVSKAIALFPGGTKIAILVLKILAKTLGLVSKAVWALGKALFALVAANPITALVIVIVAGLIFMWIKFKWFRDFVKAVGKALVTALKAAGQAIAAVFRFIGGLAVWLWENAIKPAWTAIKVAILVLATVISIWYNLTWKPTLKAAAAIFSWLYDHVIKPIAKAIVATFKAIGAAFRWLNDNVVRPVANAIGVAFKAVGAAGQWVYEHVLKPAFDGITTAFKAVGTGFAWVWSNVIKPVFDTIVRVAGTIAGAVGKAFSGIASVVEGAFNGVKHVLQNVLNFFIDIINGVIHLINKIKIHVPKVPGIGGGFDIGFALPDVPEINWFSEGTKNATNNAPVRVGGGKSGGPAIHQMAEGGTVRPRPGGTIVNIAEAGRAERVEPLDANGLSARDRAIVQALAGGSNDLDKLAAALMALASKPTLVMANGRAIAKVVNDQNKKEARR